MIDRREKAEPFFLFLSTTGGKVWDAARGCPCFQNVGKNLTEGSFSAFELALLSRPRTMGSREIGKKIPLTTLKKWDDCERERKEKAKLT